MCPVWVFSSTSQKEGFMWKKMTWITFSFLIIATDKTFSVPETIIFAVDLFVIIFQCTFNILYLCSLQDKGEKCKLLVSL